MSKRASNYPPLGEYVKVRDLPDKLRLLLLVHHAIFAEREAFLSDADEFFGSSVLKPGPKWPSTLNEVKACWSALEDDPYRTQANRMPGYLLHGLLNRLIGWAVTPDG